jgi:hypothetical protein
MTVKDRLAEYGGFIDVGILSHGFAAHMRDYDILFEALWGKVKSADAKGDASRSSWKLFWREPRTDWLTTLPLHAA